MIDIHYFLQFDASSSTASIQLTEKSEKYKDPFLKATFSTGGVGQEKDMHDFNLLSILQIQLLSSTTKHRSIMCFTSNKPSL